MVQVGESAEELLRAAHLVADDEAALAAAFDLEHLDDGPVALLDVPHHLLVDLERVLARFLEEGRVGDGAYVCLAEYALNERAGGKWVCQMGRR